ncbi:MAG: carboxyl transferase domain-containing protein [Actinocatenispora sp.]
MTDVDHRAPDVRLGRLLDAGSVAPLHEPDDSGVVAVGGRIHGNRVLVYCTDARRMGGSLGSEGTAHIVGAIDAAVAEGCPVIGLWHSGGARLAEGVESMEAVGRMFAAMIRASGRVPQISVVLGPAAGAAAYGPALTDVVVMSGTGLMFITGPEVVHSVTGEQIGMQELGGGDAHGRRSGVAHVVTETDEAAYEEARQLTALLAAPGRVDPSKAGGDSDLRALLPAESRRAYDVRPLVREILDGDFHELQARWARNMVIGFGQLGGGTVGVLANNPLRKGGCLDTLSAEKAARFVRMSDCLGIPLVVLVDVPGYLPGVNQEWSAIIRRGAKLLYAFSEAVVPRITLITRRSYGGAYIAMNSRSLGATTVLAWPEAEAAVMGAESAVRILHRKQLAAADPEEREPLRTRLIAEHQQRSGGLTRAVELGAVDEIIDPRTTRRRLAAAVAAAPVRRGAHGNIPL